MDNTQPKFTLIPADGPLDNLLIEWELLTKQIPARSFIHNYQWFISRLSAYPHEAQDTWFGTMHINHTLYAVFPLQYTTTCRYGLNLKTWCIYWPGDMGINDFIYPPNPSQQLILRHLIDYLNQQQDLMPWNLLQLQNVPESACIASSLEQFCLPRHIGSYHHDSKYIACKSSFDESTSGISSKFKRNNRRKLRKLEQSGTVHFKMAKTAEELYEAFSQFIEIEAANWKGQNNTALKYDTNQQGFYRELVKMFGRTGKCLIHSLWLDNQAIAAQFILVINDTYHLLKIGYNDDYRDVGPGSILLNETIRHCSEIQNINKISFVTGAKWNDDWSPQVVRVYNHFIYNKNFKGYIAFFMEKCKSVLRCLKHKYFKGNVDTK